MNAPVRSLTAILVCGSVIVMIAMGVRHGLGLFRGPMSTDLGGEATTEIVTSAVCDAL